MNKAVFQYGVEIKSEIDEITIAGKLYHYAKIVNSDEIYAGLAAMDANKDDVIDERIPYWSELWPSALAIAEFIASNKNLFKDNFLIHEIGCGLALPAVVSTALGYRVIISDYAEAALSFAQQNFIHNNLPQAESYLLDWRHIPDDFQTCNVLLAADVAYEKRMFTTLIDVFRKLVALGGMVLFAEPNRSYTKDFYQMLQSEGFVIEKNETKVRMNDFTHHINMCIFRRI